MGFFGLREFVDTLKDRGELITVEEEVSPKYQIGALLKELDNQKGPAVLFTKVKGYQSPVVGNLFGTKRRLAIALECPEPEGIKEFIFERGKSPIPPTLVHEASFKENIITEGIDLLKYLPVVTYHEKDAGPYITTGLIIAKDPQTHFPSMGLHRIQVRDGNTLSIVLVTPPLTEFYARAEKEGKPLEIAIVVGIDPQTLFASVMFSPHGSKQELAGALRGEPLRVTKATSVDLEVPASSEILIEGKIMPHHRLTDGPFGEVTGYYLSYHALKVEVGALCFRNKPIFHALHPMTQDTYQLISPSWEVETYRTLKALIPSLLDLHIYPGCLCDMIVISLTRSHQGEVRRALLLTLMSNPCFKCAVAVDEDVDIYNVEDVLWAITTRFQADKDLMVIPNLRGSPVDPTAQEPHFLSAKMALDATKPWDAPLDKFERSMAPQEVRKWAKSFLSKYLT